MANDPAAIAISAGRCRHRATHSAAGTAIIRTRSNLVSTTAAATRPSSSATWTDCSRRRVSASSTPTVRYPNGFSSPDVANSMKAFESASSPVAVTTAARVLACHARIANAAPVSATPRRRIPATHWFVTEPRATQRRNQSGCVNPCTRSVALNPGPHPWVMFSAVRRVMSASSLSHAMRRARVTTRTRAAILAMVSRRDCTPGRRSVCRSAATPRLPAEEAPREHGRDDTPGGDDAEVQQPLRSDAARR